MIISIASGKGGTGKTTVATTLALSLKNVQFIDCDVEEPNAHIFLKPVIQNIESVNVLVPQVDYKLCDFCGQCAKFCEYHALAVVGKKVLVFPEICHYCGGCKLVCPYNAISEYEFEIGKIQKGIAHTIEFLSGLLNITKPSSVPIINMLKSNINKKKIVIIDSPPGTACPMVHSIEGSDFCILVTEPTPFGLNDLKLAVDVVQLLHIPFGVVINQYDIGNNKVEEYCSENHIPILLKIPYQREIAVAYSQGKNLLEVIPEYESKFQNVFKTISEVNEFQTV